MVCDTQRDQVWRVVIKLTDHVESGKLLNREWISEGIFDDAEGVDPLPKRRFTKHDIMQRVDTSERTVHDVLETAESYGLLESVQISAASSTDSHTKGFHRDNIQSYRPTDAGGSPTREAAESDTQRINAAKKQVSTEQMSVSDGHVSADGPPPVKQQFETFETGESVKSNFDEGGTDESRYICDMCSDGSKSRAFETGETAKYETVEDGTDEDEYICGICTERFESERALTAHMTRCTTRGADVSGDETADEFDKIDSTTIEHEDGNPVKHHNESDKNEFSRSESSQLGG